MNIDETENAETENAETENAETEKNETGSLAKKAAGCYDEEQRAQFRGSRKQDCDTGSI